MFSGLFSKLQISFTNQIHASLGVHLSLSSLFLSSSLACVSLAMHILVKIINTFTVKYQSHQIYMEVVVKAR